MSKKFLFLLLLVLLNFVSTALADSHHFASSEAVTSERIDHSHDDSSTDSEHCEDDTCHTGHYHHYLQSGYFFKFSSYKFSISFSEFYQKFSPPFFDIIKPPLLIS